MAYDFGSEILPRKSYFSLKLGILLSIVSAGKSCQVDTENPQVRRPPNLFPPRHLFHGASIFAQLPLFVVSDNVSLPHRLMDYALHFSERPVVHCHQQMPLGTGQSNPAGGLQTTEAGSILLAQNDICYLGDLVKLKKESVAYLTSGQKFSCYLFIIYYF